MLAFFKIIFLVSSVIFLQSCATDDQDNLVLDAEGGPLISEDTEGSTGSDSTEIEVEDNIAAIVEMDDIETIDQRLANELIEVGDRVFFDYDKSIIAEEGRDTLLKQAQFLNKNSNLSITITGHCDERGTREYNLALGERRASSVKNYLVSLGIEANRISVISYGKEKPTVAGQNDWAWSQNRTAITLINN